MDEEYDNAAFQFLVNEFGEISKTNNKIKRKLKRDNLGDYDQDHIDFLRKVKDAIVEEIEIYDKSKYFIKKHGKYSNWEDYDVHKMGDDYSNEYESISRNSIHKLIVNAVYWYHLR